MAGPAHRGHLLGVAVVLTARPTDGGTAHRNGALPAERNPRRPGTCGERVRSAPRTAGHQAACDRRFASEHLAAAAAEVLLAFEIIRGR
jgi:hypothetical protein